MSPEDADLVRECLEGDAGAFGALVERHQRAIFNAALRMVNDAEDAKDISQTVFLKAYENLATYDPQYKFYSWIYRIALNESINFLNRRNRSEPLDEESKSDGIGPEDSFARLELGRMVQDALMVLTPEYRAVIVLRHFMSCSYEDISQIVQVPEKTVKSRLFTARQQLKDLLSQRGATL
jgi:RNA polymerase sigma-70 factor, ECF subfamily